MHAHFERNNTMLVNVSVHAQRQSVVHQNIIILRLPVLNENHFPMQRYSIIHKSQEDMYSMYSIYARSDDQPVRLIFEIYSNEQKNNSNDSRADCRQRGIWKVKHRKNYKLKILI